MKKCNKCLIEKSEFEFYVDRGILRGICKECTRNGRKRYYKENREKCIAASIAYVKTPKGEAKRKAWTLKRSRTPEFREKVRAWDKTEPGRESRRRRVKRFDKTPKGRAAAYRRNAKRRADKRNIVATLTADEWNNILADHAFGCKYCGVRFTEKNPPTQDHIIPISKGGHHIASNIVPSCRACNSRKKDKIL